jgi:hypothetical protein
VGGGSCAMRGAAAGAASRSDAINVFSMVMGRPSPSRPVPPGSCSSCS